MIIKKLLPFTLCGMMIFMTACAQKAQDPGPAEGTEAVQTAVNGASQETKTADTTIIVMCSEDWIEEAERELGARFEEKYGIHVDYQILPADQYQDMLLTRLNSGEGPDIWCVQSGFALTTTYNVQQNAIDLSGEPWSEAYSVFSKEQTSVKGINYGLTYYDTTTDYYMVYNKKLFEAAGVAVPTTWEELLDTCEKLKGIGVTPIYEPVADGWHELMLWTENAQVHEKLEPGLTEKLNTNQATFAANENMKKALDQINELAQNGDFGETYMSDLYADAEAALASGRYASCMLKPGSIKNIVKNDQNAAGYTEEDFDLFLLPILDNHYLNVHPTGPSRFVYSDSQNIEASKLYLAFLMEKENVQYLIDNAPKVENLPIEVGQKPEYSEVTKKFLKQYDDAHSGMVLQDVVLYFNEQWMEINADMAAMFAGDKTSADVLAGIDERRAMLAQAAKNPNW